MSEDFENENNEFTVDGITYEYNADGTVAILEQYSDDIVKYIKIPDEICDRYGRVYKITKICDNAFSECKDLEIIEISDGIEEIGEWAFSGCDNLRTVKLPNGIKEIKHSTFYECKNLQTVIIPDSVTSIGESAFFECEELNDLILPEALTQIGDSAFDYCSKLKSVYISSSVTDIGNHAFDHCDALEEIQVDHANSKYSGDGTRLIEKAKNKVLYKCNNKVETKSTGSPKRKKKANKNSTFADGKKVKDMLQDNAFTYFLGDDYTAAIVEYNVHQNPPKYLKIPSEVDDGDGITYKIKEIYGTTFFYRKELETLEIPEGIEVIGDTAFAECENLKKVILPNTLKKLGEKVFSGCKNLTDINLPDSIKILEKDVFFGCESLIKLTLPENIEEIGERAFGCCEELSELNLPRALKKIGTRAFCHCDKLQSLYFPASLEEIDGETFHGCDTLESLVVDAENEKYYSAGNCIIEKSTNSVVAGCITSVIPFGVTEIAQKAFYGSQISYLNVPESVVKIGDKAFAWSGLMEIYIPKSVVEIGDGAFDDCFTRLRCGASKMPDTWSPYVGLRSINFTTWNYPVPLVIKPIKKKESIFKKIKNLFAKIFGKK